MKRTLLIAILLAMALSMSVSATGTRVLTMGNNNNILLDDANIWLYPGRFFSYPNIAIAEFCDDPTNTFNQFGVHWKFNEQKPWTLGTYFSTGSPEYPSTSASNGTLGGLSNLPNNHRMDLFYGRPFGDMNFGFHFIYVRSGRSSDAVNNKSERSFGRYSFAFGLTPSKGDWDAAVLLSLGSWTNKDQSGVVLNDPDGYTDVALRGRCFLQYQENITFVPHAQLMFSSHGEKVMGFAGGQTWVSNNFTTSAFELSLGSGMNYTPSKNVLAALDFGVALGSGNEKSVIKASSTSAPVTSETKRAYLILPYWGLGLEADVFSWMDIRLGATSYWGNFAIKDGDRSGGTANATYLGFGFHWNRLHVDTYANPDLFLKGFNFISGGTTDMNFQISAMYEMF